MATTKNPTSWFKRNAFIFFYAVLSLLALGPLLKPGYVFLLDYVTGPHIFFDIGAASINAFPLTLVNTALAYVLTPMVAQKLVLFLCLFLSGVAMHAAVPVRQQWPRYFAGTLYMINPFVFARMQAGHIGLLLVYALTPWVISSLLRFLKEPDKRNAAVAGAWLAATAMLVLHGLYLFLVLGVGLVVYLWLNRSDRTYPVSLVKSLAILLLVFAIISAFWLVPAALVKSPVVGIDSRQIDIFATQKDQSSGVYLNVAAMNGFWQTEIFESKNAVSGWPFLFLILFALAVWGLAVGVRDEEKQPGALIVGLTAVIAFILALGVASPVTGWLYRFLFENVSVFRGFREPQKFVGLLTFSYAYLGALGLDDLMRRLGASQILKKSSPNEVEGSRTARAPLHSGTLRFLQSRNMATIVSALLAGLFIAVVIVYTWPMFWGLGGHAKSVDYPRSWYRAEEIMSEDPAPGAVLFLPWHMYMSFAFNDTGRVVANPAPHFFTRNVIYGENAELQGISSTYVDKQQKDFEAILASGKKGVEIGDELKTEGVRYVVLAKDADWPAYQWLYSQRDLEKVYGASEIVVFRVK
ncbi:MAG: hypothetical protein ABH838_01915 [Actinomycetota bacterium]